MRKAILVISLMVVSMILMAISQNININDNKIKLNFKNVKIKTLEFYDKSDLKVEYSDKTVEVVQKENNLTVSSDTGAKIEMYLPEDKTYLIEKDGVVCSFDKDKLLIKTDDGEIIRFENGEISVIDEGSNETVIVNSEGVFVDSNDEKVSISGDGIVVEGEENTNLTGFWGQLLGGFVKLIVKGSLAVVGNSPEKIVKHFVNEDNSMVGVEWGDGDEFIKKEITKSFNPKKGDKLDVSNLNGSITISSWEEDYVDLFAVIKTHKGEEELEKLQIVIDQGKNWQIISKPLDKNVKVSCEYEMKIPEFLDVNTVETTNGSIEIFDVQGELNLRASNGSLKVENVTGTVDAFTSNGKIEVENISGKVNVTTSNGRIEAVNVPFLKNAITSNGFITAKLNGLNNDLLLSTSNSRINVYLAANSDAEIYATTSNASINVHDLKISSELMTKSKLEGSLGKGGPKITASTSNARIEFNKLEN